MNAPVGTAAKPLWGDLEIPIIVGTGEFGQGKTIFGLTIAPGPETLVYDNEGSSLTYRSLGFHHVDMAEELLKKFPGGFTSLQRFEWWREDVLRRGKTGNFRVCMTDPVSEIEDGLADYVKKNHAKYGCTANQFEKSPALFWGAMKKEWQQLLDHIRTLYETVYLVVHMRDEFRGGQPTGKREPKGKETLMQLASLFIEFEREKDKKGNVAAVPSAIVHKSRLTKFAMIDGEMTPVPILPPRIPAATPKAVRQYIATPPDYAHLTAGERAKDKEISEEDKLRLQAQISANNAAAAQADLSRLEKMQQQAEAAAARKATAPVSAPDRAAEHAEATRERAANSAEGQTEGQAETEQPAEPTPFLVSPELKGRIIALSQEAFDDIASMREWLTARLAAFGAPNVAGLLHSHAETVEIELLGMKSVRLQRVAAEKLAAGGTEGDPCNARNQPVIAKLEQPTTETAAAPAAAFDPEKPGSITPEQLLRMKDKSAAAGWGYEAQQTWLKERGCSTFRHLSARQADERLDELMKIELGFAGGVPGNC